MNSARVSFRLVGGAQPLLLVPVEANGRGPFSFILDTGAGTTLLAPELAASLGVRSTGKKTGQSAGGAVEVHLGTLDSLGVGGLMRSNLEIAIHDLSPISRTVGASLDGDLGYNFLKDYRLRLDFVACELRLEDPKRCEYFGAPALVDLPMRLAHPLKPLILIDAWVNGRGPFQFALDTGTSTTAISPRLGHELGLPSHPMANVTTGGAAIAARAARVETLHLGAASVRDLDVMLGGFLDMLSQVIGKQLDGIIGYNFLRHFRVAIDYPNENLSLFAV